MEKKKNLIEEVLSSSLVQNASSKLDPEQKEKFDGMLRSFIDGFVVPLNEMVESATSNEEVRDELRKLLREKRGSNEGK